MLLHEIECFIAVVECGNFYDAAERCCISQSAVSQQIKKLENELSVELLYRHNRTFSLTKAGEHFYKKCLVLTNDINQLIKETKNIANINNDVLRIGYYKGYIGTEFSKAIALFSERFPEVHVDVVSASHDELYHAMENHSLDIVLNDQRRAFSDAYNNIVLAESTMHIELSDRNPLSKLDFVEINELKNTPCVLVINKEAQAEEEEYYKVVIGLKSEFIFADNIQEARLKALTEQAYLPIDVIDEETYGSPLSSLKLLRDNQPIKKNYCVFYRKDNESKYLDDFASILKSSFTK